MSYHNIVIFPFVVFLAVILIYIYRKSISRPISIFETQQKVIKRIYQRVIAPERILMRMDVSPFNAIREMEFVKKIELWDTLTLDATYFMLQILVRLNKKDFIKEYEGKISTFTLDLFNKDKMGFQINRENQNEVSVHSNHCALGILNLLSNYKNCSFGDIAGNNVCIDNKYMERIDINLVFDFLKECYRDGGFAEKPIKHYLATIVDTESVLWIFRLLGWLKDTSMLKKIDTDFLKKISKFVADLKSPRFSRNNEKTLAYLSRYGNKEEPYLCAVYYASRILWEIRQVDKNNNLGGLNEEEKMEILKYVLECQNEDGGFGASPNRHSNIIHTKDALSILYKRIELESPNNRNWLEREKQVISEKAFGFLESCKFENVFAFGNTKLWFSI
jgi:prenyltransferase beta subunit